MDKVQISAEKEDMMKYLRNREEQQQGGVVVPRQSVEEVPQNMFCIPSAEENIIMEMPQKIRI